MTTPVMARVAMMVHMAQETTMLHAAQAAKVGY